MPGPPGEHDTAFRLALGELEGVLSPQQAAQMAQVLLKIAQVLCAYAAADQPGPELAAQLHEVTSAKEH